jgi:putative ABC transport system permease protein
MTLRDLALIATGNLWRMKLRALLTISGVLIAITAFVAMLSFGVGNQQNVEREFNKLGLLTTMQVYPRNRPSDSSTSPKLDRLALDRLAQVPGVNLVYPFDAFSVVVTLHDTSISSKAQALPSAAVKTKLYSHLVAGTSFDSTSSRVAIVSEELLKQAGIVSPDSIIGRRIVLSVKVSTIDSALAHLLADRGETMVGRVKRVRIDSLFHRNYRTRVIRAEVSAALRRFLNGFLNAQQVISDTLTVCGVRQAGRTGRAHAEQIIIPVATAARFNSVGVGGSPTELFAAMSNGTLFEDPGDPSGRTFSQATIDFDPKVLYKTVRDSVEAMGFRTFSFAAQFEEIQRFFLYFDVGLAVVGLIALLTASLGIVNTMVMSITERRREIGVLKSLGAYERDIRALFLVESGVIGLLGTLAGIFVGWGISRIVSAVAQAYMRREGIPEMDVFATPAWLVLTALAVGVGVSLLAGYYPAARASRVDPVEALRNDS